jgi:hypothetical protein
MKIAKVYSFASQRPSSIPQTMESPLSCVESIDRTWGLFSSSTHLSK